jgi:poly(3-hydroxybutyrate) depolymerase
MSAPLPTHRPAPRAGTCPPGIVDASVTSFFDMWSSVVRHSTDYWCGLVERGAGPVDVLDDLLRWGTALTDRRPPTWSTPHEVVREWPVARLRDFTPKPRGRRPAPGGLPTLVLPPQAGHDSCIVDYAPGQSQVRTALDAGLGRVLSLDWVGATQDTKDADVEEYVAVIRETVTDLGGRVNLVGDCQGGWLAVIYAALHPQTVATLTIAGAPIDFHAGEPLIHDWIQLLSPDGRMDFYRWLVAANHGVLPGDVLLDGFKAMQPQGETDRTLGLLANLHDPAYVARYTTFENWFQHTQPIPGGFYLWIVEHLFQRNELVRGGLVVEGRVVDLKAIDCPLFLLAGTTDHITPPPQVFALAAYTSTPADQVTRLTVNGGHLGLFMGREALHEHWARVFAAIAERG